MSSEEEADFDPVPPSLVIESRELSRGSYGVVYQGRLGEKPVAVKRIHPVLLREEGSERLLKVFKNECRYLKSLNHPNVVKFKGAFRDEEGPLLVMELMEENLETFLKRNRGILSFRRQLDICNSIAKGLLFLHNCEEPIIHRDLSDRNILLAEDGTAKIADFGQSKLIDKPSKILMETRQPGAVLYMPPEVLKEDPHYTNTIDTFSLGVLMLEIATQQPPQVGLSDIGRKPELIRRVVDLERLDNGHLLKPLIIWCLQKYHCRPSASAVYNQITALKDLQKKESEIQQLQEDKGRIEKDFERQVQKYAVEKEAWFLLVDKLKDQKPKLEEQMQQTKNPEVEKRELRVKWERLEEEKREAVTEANRLQQELAGIRESHEMKMDDMRMNHQEELQLLKKELLEKHEEAIAIETAKRSNLEKEVKQLQQEKEQLNLSRKPITQAPVPRARSNTNQVASQVSQGYKPTFQDRTDYNSSTVPRRSKPSPVSPKPDYMEDLEKKIKRHTIAEMTPPVGVNISGYSSAVAPVEQVMGRTKATSPPPVKPKPKKGT